jgi:hypothetical protein
MRLSAAAALLELGFGIRELGTDDESRCAWSSSRMGGVVKKGSIALVFALAAVCITGLLAGPAAAAARKAVEGRPWTGSYLRSSTTVVHSRDVWLKWQGIYATWADGGPDWDIVWGRTNMGVMTGKVTGDVSKVLKWDWPTFEGRMDSAHPEGGIYTSAGRVKVRLKSGNGPKVIKLGYSLKIVQQYNYCNFEPYYPWSPTYKTTLKLAM